MGNPWPNWPLSSKPGQKDRVFALWERHLKKRVATNPAQERYFFCHDMDDPDMFFLFEVYDDPASLAKNVKAPWFAEYMAAVGPLLDGPPEVFQTTPQWIKNNP